MVRIFLVSLLSFHVLVCKIGNYPNRIGNQTVTEICWVERRSETVSALTNSCLQLESWASTGYVDVEIGGIGCIGFRSWNGEAAVTSVCAVARYKYIGGIHTWIGVKADSDWVSSLHNSNNFNGILAWICKRSKECTIGDWVCCKGRNWSERRSGGGESVSNISARSVKIDCSHDSIIYWYSAHDINEARTSSFAITQRTACIT